MRLVAAATLALALCAPALGGAARSVDVPRTFAPQLVWVKRGTRVPLYTWQAKDLRAPQKAVLIRMANQAIAAGPR